MTSAIKVFLVPSHIYLFSQMQESLCCDNRVPNRPPTHILHTSLVTFRVNPKHQNCFEKPSAVSKAADFIRDHISLRIGTWDLMI